ncbi:MAG: hypothetical protein KAU21_18650 [Gammaproteobacteria bacterium]|nr:hypothetical protein [Gammaproteobacteria bacterium]
MSLITDEQPPSDTEDNLSEYLVRMFRDAATSDDVSDQFHVRTALPEKPITGKMYYFKQIPDTTIYREGFYWYDATEEVWRYAGVSDFYFDVAAGQVAGHDPLPVIGHDSNISTTLGTVGHENGLLHEHSTTADIDSISSTDAGNTHDITIEGLDIDYNPVAPFTVTLNGLSRVALPTSLFRITCVRNDTSTATLGEVYVFVDTPLTSGKPTDETKIRSSIQRIVPASGAGVSNERCANSVKTIPAGKEAYIVFGKMTVSDSKAIELSFWVKPENGVPILAHHIDIVADNYDYFFKLPASVAEKTDVEVRAFVTSGTAHVSANYDMILKDMPV